MIYQEVADYSAASSFLAFLAGAFLGLGRLFSGSRGFVVCRQLFLGNHLVGDLHLGEQLIDDLFFKDRGAKAGDGFRVVAEEIIDLLFLATILANLIVDGALQFLLGHFDIGCLTDFGKHEAKAHAALGKAAIFGSSFFFRGFFVRKGLAGGGELTGDLLPDVVELGVDQLGRRFKLVQRVELVEQLALDLLAGVGAELAFDLLAHDLTQALCRFDAKLLGQFIVDDRGRQRKKRP